MKQWVFILLIGAVMTTYNTGNAVGSTDPRDLYDNAENLDKLSVGSEFQYQDRLGVPRKSWAGLEQQVADWLAAQGWEAVTIPYAASAAVQRPTQLVERDGELYRVALQSQLPLTLSGDWAIDAPKLVAVGNSALRRDLEGTEFGAAIVGRSVVVYQTMAALNAEDPSKLGTDKLYRVVDSGLFEWDGAVFHKLIDRQGELDFRKSLPGRRFTAAQISNEISYTPARVLFAKQGTGLQFVELIFPVTTGQTAVIDFEVETNTSDIGATSASAVHASASRCQNADRGTPVAIAGATVTVDSGRIRATVAAADVTAPYLAVSLRMNAGTNSSLVVKSMSARHGAKLLAKDMFDLFPRHSDWGSIASNVKLPTQLGDVNSRVQLSAGSTPGVFSGPSRVDVAPNGSSDATFPPYALDFYAEQIHGKGYARRVALAAGDYTFSQKAHALNATENVTLVAVGGKARIFGGRELPTSSWTQFTDGTVKYYSATYDWATNHDSAIRAGTKQPFVTYMVPSGRDHSVHQYISTAVTSVAAVKTTPRSHFYDYAAKKVYFSEGGVMGDATAYIYVAEMDFGIGAIAQTNLRAVGIDVLATKTDGWYFRRESGYSPVDSGGAYVALHSCGAYANLSMGMTINNVDYEIVDCDSLSNHVDGMNFHYQGAGIVEGGRSWSNGDDGISHHEQQIGHVLKASMRYNGAGSSTPAFGARVLHTRCESIPASINTLSSKSYAGGFAVLSGQGANAAGVFDTCFSVPVTDGRPMYAANAQAVGTTAEMLIKSPRSPSADDPLFGEYGPGTTQVSAQ